jgi:DDE family transposase
MIFLTDLLYSAGMIDETAIGERYRALAGELDECRRRLWAAAAARATGMAENTIRRGLRELETGEHLGRERYPDARTLTVTADCGGANGYRTRLWKVEVQRLADETGLAIQVCHFPPGTMPRGTRSSIGCSPSSPSTGAANRSPSLRRSST